MNRWPGHSARGNFARPARRLDTLRLLSRGVEDRWIDGDVERQRGHVPMTEKRRCARTWQRAAVSVESYPRLEAGERAQGRDGLAV